MGLPRKFLGDTLIVNLDDEAKVKDMLEYLNTLLREKGVHDQFVFDPIGIVVLINGTEISALKRENTKLKDGDNVVIVPIIHGG